MTTICTGWTEPHPQPIVLKAEDGKAPGVSHGICPACSTELERQMHEHERFVNYTRGTEPDPRD